MIKEIKYGGYTVSPSDYDSPDGDLALSFNLVPKNGELHGMHTPSTIGSLQEGEELIFIHTVNDNTKFLIIKKIAQPQKTVRIVCRLLISPPVAAV